MYIRNSRWMIGGLVISLALLTLIIGLLSPVLFPEKYSKETLEKIKEDAPAFVVESMESRIQQHLTDQAIQHEAAQVAIDAALDELGFLESLSVFNPHRVTLGGRGLIVSVNVLGKTENNLAVIRQASSLMLPAVELLLTQIRIQYPNISNLPTFDFSEVTVSIDVDPGKVDEMVWMKAVAEELVPGCTSSPSLCFAEYKQSYLEGFDFVILALHPQEKVFYPGGSGHKIGGYAYPGYLVLSGQDDYIRFGYGPQVAAHELLHTFGVPHPIPGGSAGPFGYFAELNSEEHSIMSQVQGGLVTKRVMCQAGLCDRNDNQRFDLNEGQLTIELDTDIRCIVIRNNPVQSMNSLYPIQTIGYGDWVTTLDGIGRTTLVLPIERIDRTTTRACFTSSLLGKSIDVYNRTTGAFVHECFGCHRNFLPAVVRR